VALHCAATVRDMQLSLSEVPHTCLVAGMTHPTESFRPADTQISRVKTCCRRCGPISTHVYGN
jgi:hypothetical protein